METRRQVYKNAYENYSIKKITTIQNLCEKEALNEELTEEEELAIVNFDRFRLSVLNKIKNDSEFSIRYSELKLLSNQADYKEFLKEEYFSSELL